MSVNPTTTLSKLRKEIQKPEEFTIRLTNNKLVTFPDVFELDSVEAEDIFASLENEKSSAWGALELWLSEADFKKLKSEKLTVRELKTLVESVMSYYESQYGSQEKG